MRRPTLAAPALALLLAAPLAAPLADVGPGGGHAGHDHDHDHDHGPAPEQAAVDALRKPLIGDWAIDVDATLDAMPTLAPAIQKQGRAAVAADLRRQLGEVRMSFLPDGGLLSAGSDGLKHGLYAVQRGPDGALTVFAYDTEDNRLATSEYAVTITGDRLALRHAGDTMVFRRGATAGLDARLVGRWTVDVARTLAADPRQRTLTAEQQKASRDAMAGFFGGINFRFGADGIAETQVAGESHPGRWRVTDRAGDRLDVEITGPRGVERMRIDLDGDHLRMVMTSQPNARPLVLQRAK
ncbi:MAG: hypothetical protein R3F65_15695 [bacterium]